MTRPASIAAPLGLLGLVLLLGAIGPWASELPEPPVPSPAPGEEVPWLEVDAPKPGAAPVDSPLYEVLGHGGRRRGAGHDLVIVLDVSGSTLEDSGIDLDGDGAGARTRPTLILELEAEGVSSRVLRKLRRHDFDDTVLAAEIEAARALVARLDPGRFRVGIVTFADDARELAPIGSSREELDRALDTILYDFHSSQVGTHFGAAVSRAHNMLVAADGGPADRLRSIVFLTDGAPTRPVHGDRAERYAVRAAIDAGYDGIRLFAFAIGPEAEAGIAVMENMTTWTAGRVESVKSPARVVSRLRHLDLVGLADLAVSNQTTGEEARALRAFPDGSFDGFVSLAPGRNRLVFEARDADGGSHRIEREISYQPGVKRDSKEGSSPSVGSAGDPPGEGEAALLEALRQRTAELEAWADVEARRAQQEKDLELRVEDPPQGGSGS